MGERKDEFEIPHKVDITDQERFHLVPAVNYYRSNTHLKRYAFRTKLCYYYEKGSCRYGAMGQNADLFTTRMETLVPGV